MKRLFNNAGGDRRGWLGAGVMERSDPMVVAGRRGPEPADPAAGIKESRRETYSWQGGLSGVSPLAFCISRNFMPMNGAVKVPIGMFLK